MTTPGRYAAADGTFAKSAGSAAARGGVLIAVAVALGLIILAVGYDGGDDSAAVDDSAADDTSADVAADDTTPTDDTTTDDDATVDDDATAADDATADDDVAADDDTTSPPPTATARPAGEVKVVVANGVGEAGLAGAGTDTLTTAGYVANPTNAATVPAPDTQILYIEGYAADAAAVAAALGAPASVIGEAPPDPGALVTADDVGDFHIFVIQGEDRLAG